MKTILHIYMLLLVVSATAQNALFNNGNMRVHEGGTLGFHTNFINESPFDTNLGLVGFYGGEPLTISGNITPQFFDAEVILDNDLALQLGTDIRNNLNFILGNISTPLAQPDLYVNFLDSSFYAGENDMNKVIGYAAITNQQQFLYPVGDEDFLRPLLQESEDINFFSKCAYFFEDPNNPTNFPSAFNTFEVDLDVEFVTEQEFWRLEGNVPSIITLSWNERSDMATLTDDFLKIVVVGWSKVSQRWINLSSETPLGDINQGFVTSISFVPDEFGIITLGVSKIPFEPLSREVLSLENYFVSVNNDGVNDNFFIPELEDFESNFVQIFDRYGIKVFEMENYTNEFSGFSNQNNVPFGDGLGLPTGVYFYTINLPEEQLDYQGFLYLAR